MKNNICIICRDKDLARGVAEELSKKLGIHYADTMGIVEYKLSDFFAVAESLEPGYLDRLVLKEIEEISTYSECCYYVTYEFIDQLLVSKKIVANSVLVLLCPTRKNFATIISPTVKRYVDVRVPLNTRGVKNATKCAYEELLKFFNMYK